MTATSPAFSSRLGFILAAAGSAVGLGNIWGFPTQAASNGGGAFVLVYLLMILVLAYPTLVAELTIGRLRQQNPVATMRTMSHKPLWRRTGVIAAVVALATLGFILAFYAIVAGWLLGYLFAAVFEIFGQYSVAEWFVSFSIERNLLMMALFMVMTVRVVRSGVKEGIERWSKRLMPLLFVLLIAMAIYVLTLPGAWQGLVMYVTPDFSQVTDPELVIRAMGQAFFSLSIGLCCMMTYGAYLSKDENLPKTAGWVAGVDSAVALLAGMLILPAMFAAQDMGVTIYSETGELLSADTLVFTVLPAMFDSMGPIGNWIAVAFFVFMVIAAITSSISMLEAPVNTIREELHIERATAARVLGLVITGIAATIIYNFETLFGLVITVTTVYMQPLMAIIFGFFLTWILRQHLLLKALQGGSPNIEKTWFWKLWPGYVKFVCPVLILLVIFV